MHQEKRHDYMSMRHNQYVSKTLYARQHFRSHLHKSFVKTARHTETLIKLTVSKRLLVNEDF